MLIGTYRDLAVGVAKQSCDVWADVDNVFRTKGSIGAPPDPLGPLGQNWGLAPMAPSALKACAYKPMIAMYKANMQSCGAIRIDHAAGLFRLWITKLVSQLQLVHMFTMICMIFRYHCFRVSP